MGRVIYSFHMTQKETEKVAFWVLGESNLSHITVAECSWIRKETQGVLSILQRLVVFLFVTCFYRKGKVSIYIWMLQLQGWWTWKVLFLFLDWSLDCWRKLPIGNKKLQIDSKYLLGRNYLNCAFIWKKSLGIVLMMEFKILDW